MYLFWKTSSATIRPESTSGLACGSTNGFSTYATLAQLVEVIGPRLHRRPSLGQLCATRHDERRRAEATSTLLRRRADPCKDAKHEAVHQQDDRRRKIRETPLIRVFVRSGMRTDVRRSRILASPAGIEPSNPSLTRVISCDCGPLPAQPWRRPV